MATTQIQIIIPVWPAIRHASLVTGRTIHSAISANRFNIICLKQVVCMIAGLDILSIQQPECANCVIRPAKTV